MKTLLVCLFLSIAAMAQNDLDAPSPQQHVEWVAHCPSMYEVHQVWLYSSDLMGQYHGAVLNYNDMAEAKSYYYCQPVCGVDETTHKAKSCVIGDPPQTLSFQAPTGGK